MRSPLRMHSEYKERTVLPEEERELVEVVKDVNKEP